MKKRIALRLLALLMSIILSASSFVACQNKTPSTSVKNEESVVSTSSMASVSDSNASSESSKDQTQTDTSKSENTTSTDTSVPEEEGNYVFEIVYPTVSVSSFKFKLTDKALQNFKSKLTAAKQMFYNNQNVSENKFKHALYELLSLEAEMCAQRDIAYMSYLYDMSSSDAWDDYLYAYDMCETVTDLFWGFYAESKQYSHKLSKVFKEVIAKEYGGNTVYEYPEADEYARQKTVLEKEYNSIKDSNASDEEVFEVYKKYMVAANGQATASCTNNYYEYASNYAFGRNDTAAQRELLRQYTKKYLVPLCKELKRQSEVYDSMLSSYEMAISEKYLDDRYDSFDENYLFDYFSSLPKSSGDLMRGAFKKDRVLVGDKSGSYNSAMVRMVGDTPICYFHESMLSLDTVAHEIGHYYADSIKTSMYYAYDLSETHSTSNVMLLYSYLSNRIHSRAFVSTELFMRYNWMYLIVMSVIKDEFDEAVYSRNPSTLTLADFENIMSDLIKEYDASAWAGNGVNKLMTYWRRLGIVYPMSNYSYATSMITAFQIYIKSKDNYDAACEIYRKTAEEVQQKGDFVATIVNAGLLTPYDEQTYIELKKITKLS